MASGEAHFGQPTQRN